MCRFRLAKQGLVASIFALFFSSGALSQTNVNDGSPSLSVLTATQVTYSLTSAVLKDTGIKVINIPSDGRRFDALKDYIERRQDEFKPTFESAQAVVSMTNALAADPLYRFAREANIHLVNIDAAQPWSYTTTGVSIAEAPTTSVNWGDADSGTQTDSPYFWLSLSNAIRMTEIIGSDLARVFPEYAEQINLNRNQTKNEFLSMSRHYQNQLIEVADITVFALANEFVYLTNDMGLYVENYFLKQDIDWTQEDLLYLTEHLRSRSISVVLHKWVPDEKIQQAIQEAGAALVVLNTADPGISSEGTLVSDGYQQIMKENMDNLALALKTKPLP